MIDALSPLLPLLVDISGLGPEYVDLTLFLLSESRTVRAMVGGLSLSGCCRSKLFLSQPASGLPLSEDFANVQGLGSRLREEESEAAVREALGPCRERTPVLGSLGDKTASQTRSEDFRNV